MVLWNATLSSMEYSPVTQLHSSTFGMLPRKRKLWFVLRCYIQIDKGNDMVTQLHRVNLRMISGNDTVFLQFFSMRADTAGEERKVFSAMVFNETRALSCKSFKIFLSISSITVCLLSKSADARWLRPNMRSTKKAPEPAVRTPLLSSLNLILYHTLLLSACQQKILRF